MKNYFFSILIHIIAFLLLLMLWQSKAPEETKPIHAIVVDFSSIDSPQESSTNPASPKAPSTQLSKPTNQTINEEKEEPTETTQEIKKASSQKQITSTEKAKGQSAKEIKSSDTESKKRQEEALLAAAKSAKEKAEKEAAEKKRLEEEKSKKQAEEKARQEAEAKAKKVSEFKNLFKKSAEIAKAKEESDSSGDQQNTTSDSPNSGQKVGNIEGAIGKRRVLKIPIIQDNSQKQGKVVVKICVDSSGKVSSAQYTQVGSTTADAYLIKLAEKGAREYLFSPSTIDLECGRVIIEFKLRA